MRTKAVGKCWFGLTLLVRFQTSCRVYRGTAVRFLSTDRALGLACIGIFGGCLQCEFAFARPRSASVCEARVSPLGPTWSMAPAAAAASAAGSAVAAAVPRAFPAKPGIHFHRKLAWSSMRASPAQTGARTSAVLGRGSPVEAVRMLWSRSRFHRALTKVPPLPPHPTKSTGVELKQHGCAFLSFYKIRRAAELKSTSAELCFKGFYKILPANRTRPQLTESGRAF